MRSIRLSEAADYDPDEVVAVDGVAAVRASILGECIEVRHHDVPVAVLVDTLCARLHGYDDSSHECQMTAVEPEPITLTSDTTLDLAAPHDRVDTTEPMETLSQAMMRLTAPDTSRTSPHHQTATCSAAPLTPAKLPRPSRSARRFGSTETRTLTIRPSSSHWPAPMAASASTAPRSGRRLRPPTSWSSTGSTGSTPTPDRPEPPDASRTRIASVIAFSTPFAPVRSRCTAICCCTGPSPTCRRVGELG